MPKIFLAAIAAMLFVPVRLSATVGPVSEIFTIPAPEPVPAHLPFLLFR